jgi:hypothetical protein
MNNRIMGVSAQHNTEQVTAEIVRRASTRVAQSYEANEIG